MNQWGDAYSDPVWVNFVLKGPLFDYHLFWLFFPQKYKQANVMNRPIQYLFWKILWD